MNRCAELNYLKAVERVVHIAAPPLAELRLEQLAAPEAQAPCLLKQGRRSITQVGLEVGTRVLRPLPAPSGI